MSEFDYSKLVNESEVSFIDDCVMSFQKTISNKSSFVYVIRLSPGKKVSHANFNSS